MSSPFEAWVGTAAASGPDRRSEDPVDFVRALTGHRQAHRSQAPGPPRQESAVLGSQQRAATARSGSLRSTELDVLRSGRPTEGTKRLALRLPGRRLVGCRPACLKDMRGHPASARRDHGCRWGRLSALPVAARQHEPTAKSVLRRSRSVGTSPCTTALDAAPVTTRPGSSRGQRVAHDGPRIVDESDIPAACFARWPGFVAIRASSGSGPRRPPPPSGACPNHETVQGHFSHSDGHAYVRSLRGTANCRSWTGVTDRLEAGGATGAAERASRRSCLHDRQRRWGDR
jgi:hypothetical protein